ncbi:MAG: PleD family two-component system response regulator [Chthoniobacterales bacterium]
MTFPKKILLIDHDPAVTRPVRDALERSGRYSVREEHDEHAAVRVAQFFQPDLILLDFMTSVVEATALARQIRSDATLAETPVLCISGFGVSDDVTSAGVLSGYSFFAAPMRIGEVLRGIEQLLFGSRSD